MAVAELAFALTTTGYGQTPSPEGQRGAGAGQGQPVQQGQRGGQRGGQPAAPAPPTPRWADGKPIMGAIPGEGTGLWNSAGFAVLGQLDEIPFQPWARAVAEQRLFDQFEPHTRCKPSGVSRQFSTPYGVEFVEVRDLQRFYVMDQGGPGSYRIIYMDSRAFPEDIAPTNYGYSIGHWEGDTLVVETRGLNERFWIDRGTPHTKHLKFTERFTRVNRNTMQYQATIDDPGAFTKPWTTRLFTMRWNPGAELYEYICQDYNLGPELMLGSQDEVDHTRFFVP